MNNYKLNKECINGKIKKRKKSAGKIVMMTVSGILVSVMVFSTIMIKNADRKRASLENSVSQVYYVQTEKYAEIIKEIKFALEKVGCNDPLEIFSMYNHLLWKGYFSEGHEYKYDNSDLYDIPYFEGLDIMDGDGVCRHNSDLLARIFNEYGYKAFTVNAYVSEDMDINYQPGIERPVGGFTDYGYGNYFTSTYGNHQLVVVIDGNSVNFFDPTNLSVYRLGSDETLHVINGSGQMQLKPLSEYSINGINVEEMVDVFEMIHNENNISYSSEEVESAFEESFKTFKDNTDYFEKFYSDMEDDYAEINKSFET